jgi:hypothetical protein
MRLVALSMLTFAFCSTDRSSLQMSCHWVQKLAIKVDVKPDSNDECPSNWVELADGLVNAFSGGPGSSNNTNI